MRTSCPECGHESAWADLFDPRRQELNGFIEHAHGPLRVFADAWRTWIVALAPPLFFAQVTLDRRVRIGRMVVWLLLVIVVPHAIASACAMLHLFLVHEIRLTMPVAIPGRTVPQFLTAWTYPLALLSNTWGVTPAWTTMRWPPYVAPGLAFSGSWVVLMVLLPQSRHRAKLLFGHVLRGAVYGSAWIVVLVLYRMLRNMRLVLVEGRNYLEATSNGPGAAAFGWRLEPVAYLSESGAVVDTVCAALLFGWVSVWWLCAITRGWRMHLGWLVWLLGMVIATLSALVARAYLPEGMV